MTVVLVAVVDGPKEQDLQLNLVFKGTCPSIVVRLFIGCFDNDILTNDLWAVKVVDSRCCQAQFKKRLFPWAREPSIMIICPRTHDVA